MDLKNTLNAKRVSACLKPFSLFLFIQCLAISIYAQNSSAYHIVHSRHSFTTKQHFEDTGSIMQIIRTACDIYNDYPKQWNTSLKLLEKAILKSQTTGFINGMLLASYLTGNLYQRNGDYEQSIQYLKSALTYSSLLILKDPIRMQKTISKICDQLGNAFASNAQSDSAIFYWDIVVQISYGNPSSEEIYNRFGGIYYQLDEYSKADYYAAKAEQIARSKNNGFILSEIMVNKGSIYFDKGDSTKAISYFSQALNYGRTSNNILAQVRALTNIGIYYSRVDSIDKALSYLWRAKELTKQGEISIADKINVDLGLGAAYSRAKDYNKSIKIYNTVLQRLQNVETIALKNYIFYAKSSLAINYASISRYNEAYKYSSAAMNMLDTVRSSKERQNANLQIKYLMAEKNKQLIQKQLIISQQQTRLIKKNSLIWGITGGFVMLCIIMLLLYRYKQRLESEKVRNLQQEFEIKQLKASLNGEERERARLGKELHDGIACQLLSVKLGLTTLQNQRHKPILHDDLNETLTQLEEASVELRKTAHNLMPETLLQGGLNAAVHHFCDNIGKSSGIEVDFQVFGAVPPLVHEFELFLYRTIQELVQNVIKHAKATKLIVQIASHPGLLNITVEDNGIGMTEQVNGNSHGLKNIKAMLATMDGRIDIITPSKGGTAVNLEFDINNMQQTKYAN